MDYMAILKHTSSKNVNYTDVIQYLIFKYDESINKPLLDDFGNLQMRDQLYIDGINCDPMTFDLECKQLNAQYHKNQTNKEVKTHQYIISFDPKDVTEGNLTGEKAHELGLEFARKNFPGHQILVATHTDGNNKSGNIHVHIVLNSLRKLDVPEQVFMERECDHKAGYKHHQTREFLNYLKLDLMELCDREHLNQIDLLSPSTNKISQAEYVIQQKGQKKLNELNKKILADGLTPTSTIFETQKQFLRNSIHATLKESSSIEEFKSVLFGKYKIKVRDKRGRFSYLHPERQKAISERSLGTIYSKKELLSKIEKQAISSLEPDYRKNPFAIFTYKSELRLVIKLQNCIKAQQNDTYARKVKLTNLQQMANTLIFLQDNHYDSLEQLKQNYKKISTAYNSLQSERDSLTLDIIKLNEQLHYLYQYHTNKCYFIEMLNCQNKNEFYKNHSPEIKKYEDAKKYLNNIYSHKSYPSIQEILLQKKQMKHKLNTIYKALHTQKKMKKELDIVISNSSYLLHKKEEKFL